MKASEIIRAKLKENGGTATVYGLTGRPYKICLTPDETSFSCDLMTAKSYKLFIFDEIVAYMQAHNGKILKGDGINYKFGHPNCDENTAVGIIAINYKKPKIGDSILHPIHFFAAILDWADIAYNRRGNKYLELKHPTKDYTTPNKEPKPQTGGQEMPNQELKKIASIVIKIKAGREYFFHDGAGPGSTTIYQTSEGTITPDGRIPKGQQPPTFEMLDYEWDGPAYETVRKKGGGALFGLGAGRGILGSMLGGSAHSGKNRTFDKEIKSNAYLTLKNTQTEEVFTILFDCDSAIDINIKNMLRKAGLI